MTLGAFIGIIAHDQMTANMYQFPIMLIFTLPYGARMSLTILPTHRLTKPSLKSKSANPEKFASMYDRTPYNAGLPLLFADIILSMLSGIIR